MSQFVRLEGKHSTQNAHCALWTPEFLESLNKSCFPSSSTVPIFKEGNLKPPSLNKVRLTTRLDMVANGIVPCHIDVMMMQVGSHRSEPQRLRAQNIWCRYFSPCSRFQLMVYSWRCSKTWVDYDTDQSGPPWKVVPWPVVGRHRPAWEKECGRRSRTQCSRAQSTVHSAKSSQLGPSSPRLFYHVKQVGWVQQCQTYSSKSSSRRGSAAERAQKSSSVAACALYWEPNQS